MGFQFEQGLTVWVTRGLDSGRVSRIISRTCTQGFPQYVLEGISGFKAEHELELYTRNSDSVDDDSFYLVWSPNGHNPTYRHGGDQPALAEAERLAKKSPGEQFFVCHVTHRVTVGAVEKVKLTDVPF